jgi:Holliday junction DNA helicase RuvB
MAIISSKQSAPDPHERSHQRRSTTTTDALQSAGVVSSQGSVPEPALLQPQSQPEEFGKAEEGLRPRRLADYIGQKSL